MNERIVKQSKDQNTTISARLLARATRIGVRGGLLAMGYYLLLQGALRTVWDGLAGVRLAGVRLAVMGGLTLGLLAQLSPMSLLWGEFQIDRIINIPAALLKDHSLGAAVGLLVLLAAVKVQAVSVTLRTGFRGGFILPLMFIGGAIGTAAMMATCSESSREGTPCGRSSA